jgi:serine/threonine-protein kinase
MEHEERLKAALADRYQIEGKIGSGGMATVYLAQDIKHNRQVAVKVLEPDLAQSLGSERFLREIETVANLTHPHILPLFDSGEADGFLFYVMPYVRGESLRSRLTKERQLPIEDAVQITREIADALAYAHEEGVIHRDVKPANIMLESGYAVLADFGVAHALAEARDERITRTGTSLGTPGYMSPEQAMGERDLDGRSDQYALGCVLYEMLAGHPPFTGAQVETVVRKHLTEEPPSVAHSRPAVPGEVAKVITRSLAKSPADRFKTTGEMAAALALTTTPTPARTLGPRKSVLIPVSGAVVVTLGAVGLWSWFGNRAPPALVPGQTEQVTFDSGLELDPAISPDGKMVAYVAGPFGAMRIYLRQVGGGRDVLLTDGLEGDHRWPRWSPDGTEILFRAQGGAYVIPALGGTPRRLIEDPPGPLAVTTADWSPDGSRIAYAVGNEVLVISIDGSDPEKVAEDYEPHSIVWSPDGSRLAYVSGNADYVLGTFLLANGASSTIRVVALDNGDPVTVTGTDGVHQSPVWLPGGERLLYISDVGGARDVHEVRLGPSGSPEGLSRRLTTNLGALTLSVSADGGKLAYSVFRNLANIWSVPIPEQGVISMADASPVTSGTQAIEGITVSPDGEWLAFDSNRRGNFDIYRLRLPDGQPEQLTDDPTDDFIPSWSPDGEEIAFYSFRHGTRDLFVMRADGSSEVRLTSDSAQDRYPDWSPDGNSLAFYSDRSGIQAPWVISRVDRESAWGEPRQLADQGYHPRWSPDGRRIAYNNRVGNGEIRLISPEGGDSGVLVEGGLPLAGHTPYFLRWSADGKDLYIKTRDPEGGAGFWSVPVDGGEPRLLVRLDDPMRPSLRYEFATDGSRFFFTIGQQESDLWVMDLISG